MNKMISSLTQQVCLVVLHRQAIYNEETLRRFRVNHCCCRKSI